MNTFRTLLMTLAVAISSFCTLLAEAGGVKQLTFGAYNRDRHTCDLSELGFMHDSDAKTYPGRIERNGKGAAGRVALCNVSIPRVEFDHRYQYCALASVETIQPSGYVCEVFHFKDSVLFSYTHAGPTSELPMCSFVCPVP